MHPETPAAGISLKKRFPGLDTVEFFGNLNRAGQPYGVKFSPNPMLSNSRLALAAAEFARDNGRYNEFHHLVYQAYFTDALDIGRKEVILDLADGLGLDTSELSLKLDQGAYDERLQKAAAEAVALGVKAIPAFFFGDGREKIVGAQPLSVFQETLRRLLAET